MLNKARENFTFLNEFIYYKKLQQNEQLLHKCKTVTVLKHHKLKTYGEVQVKLQAFTTQHQTEVTLQFHALVLYPQGNSLWYH